MTCFLKNFEDFFIFKNMGSYIVISVTVVQIISIIWYAYNGINSINSFVVNLVKKNLPKNQQLSKKIILITEKKI